MSDEAEKPEPTQEQILRDTIQKELIRIDREARDRAAPWLAMLAGLDAMSPRKIPVLDATTLQPIKQEAKFAVNEHVAIIAGTYYGENGKIVAINMLPTGGYSYEVDILTGNARHLSGTRLINEEALAAE